MKITIEVSDAFINGALAEPHSKYWAHSATWDPATMRGFVFEDEGTRRIPLSITQLTAALEYMAERYPLPFAHLKEGNYDGPIGDMILQLMAFGEMKYG